MTADGTERAHLLELLAEIDSLIERIDAGNARAADEGRALLVRAQDLRVSIQSAIKAQL